MEDLFEIAQRNVRLISALLEIYSQEKTHADRIVATRELQTRIESLIAISDEEELATIQDIGPELSAIGVPEKDQLLASIHVIPGELSRTWRALLDAAREQGRDASDDEKESIKRELRELLDLQRQFCEEAKAALRARKEGRSKGSA